MSKNPFGQEGCRVNGYFFCQRADTEVNFTTDMSTAFMDMISNQFENQGIKIINRSKAIDFSHKINVFQIGTRVSKTYEL